MARVHQCIKDLDKWAKPRGWKYETRNNGHFKWSHPKVGGYVYSSGTASDHRATKNSISIMRRKMAEVGLEA